MAEQVTLKAIRELVAAAETACARREAGSGGAQDEHARHTYGCHKMAFRAVRQALNGDANMLRLFDW